MLADNIQDALYQVANGKADAYVGDAISINYAISQLGLLNLRFSGNTGYSSSYSVAVIKKHTELLSIMKKVIASIPISEREQINDRWINLKVTNGISIKTVLPYAVGVLFIMLFFMAWNARLRSEVTRRKTIEQQLRTLTVAIEQNPASVMITDLNGVLQYVNPRFTEVTGYSAAEVLGKNPRLLQSSLTTKETYNQLWSILVQGKIWQGELINRRKNGEVYWEDVHIAPVKDSEGVTTHYVGVKLDITERKAAEEEIKRLAFFDPLTGLPNRRKLLDRLQYAITLNHRANSKFAIFMMDLDKFKAVNDSLGHAAGDELLKQVAARITEHLRDSDMVARLGGDEFVLVLENLKIPEAAEIIALKMIADLTVPFQLSDTDCVQIGASIGISIYPQHGSTPEILMDHADTALYQAKSNGRGCFAYLSDNGLNLL